MQLRDLGTLSGPVALVGGSHSNLAAMRTFLSEAVRTGVAPRQMVHTGDVAGYCAHPAEVTALVRQSGMAVVAGNVERQLAVGAADCGCGFAPGTACDRLSAAWYGHALAHTDNDMREWMAELPDLAVFSHHGRRYAVIHGGLSDIARFLWPVSPDEVFRHEIHAITAAAGPVDGVVAGHCGLAFQRVIDGVHWINAGALGLPPHDGRQETRYAVMGEDGVVLHRLKYDPGPEVVSMRRAGLDQGYDRALETGIWPSQEVLPEEMRR